VLDDIMAKVDTYASVIPCQINTKIDMTIPDFDKTWFLHIVSLVTFTHGQFQHYMLYCFRVRASQKVNY